jgi:hypothetical protein
MNGPGKAYVTRYSEELTVALAGSGAGSVTSEPGGISCPGDCSDPFDPGATVTLTATAEEASTFGGWSGDCSGSGPTCGVTMDQAKDVIATFTGAPKTVTLTAKPKKVVKGKRVKLTAAVSPCAGHEGDVVEFYRGAAMIASVPTDQSCVAVHKRRVKKKATFTAVSPQQDGDHVAGESKPLTVKVK